MMKQSLLKTDVWALASTRVLYQLAMSSVNLHALRNNPHLHVNKVSDLYIQGTS